MMPTEVLPKAISDDETLVRAALLVVISGKASTAFLQTRLGIDYQSASIVMGRLEAANVVGSPNEVGKRIVLIANPIIDSQTSNGSRDNQPVGTDQSEYGDFGDLDECDAEMFIE